MAGVRISSVTAVGLMTMAAFIGAGGLGYLVFSGIRTVNNLQILAGAIPACLLALLVDFLMGLVEKLVTPISLQPQFGRSKAELAKTPAEKAVLVVAAALVVVLVGNTFVGGLRQDDRSITLGSKDFTEQLILCNLYADVIEHDTDISVERKGKPGRQPRSALKPWKKGEIDMYVDYTGTVYVNIPEP